MKYISPILTTLVFTKWIYHQSCHAGLPIFPSFINPTPGGVGIFLSSHLNTGDKAVVLVFSIGYDAVTRKSYACPALNLETRKFY